MCVKYITDCSECVYGVYCNIELLTVNCKNSAVYWVEHEVEGTTALRKAGNTASHTHQKIGSFFCEIFILTVSKKFSFIYICCCQHTRLPLFLPTISIYFLSMFSYTHSRHRNSRKFYVEFSACFVVGGILSSLINEQ